MRRTKDQWRRDVFASRHKLMTGSAKVLCLYLADHMSAERHVSLPRHVIADALGVHPQRVAERFQKAVAAGFLVHVRGTGRPGLTAEYQGTWPNDGAGRRTAPQDVLPKRRRAVRGFEADPRNGAGRRTAPLDAIDRPRPTGPPTTPKPRTGEPDKRSDEEPHDRWPEEDPYLAEVAE